jgi:dTMP kinase
MEDGKFIVFEGLDGSGTTTQAHLLNSYLFDKDKSNGLFLTREPNHYNEQGREIRRRLEGNLLPGEEVIDDFQYWADLFVGNREFHLTEYIIPNKLKGIHSISDRHTMSTLAYQSAQGGQMEHLVKMHENFQTPDLTLFVDVPASVALERIKKNREGTPEYFEAKESFLEHTANNYQKVITLVGDAHNVVTIDGTMSIDDVAKAVRTQIDNLFGYE